MSGQKFGRNYKLTILPPDGGPPIIITPPTSLGINCTRGLLGSQNILDLDIYNLSTSNQRRIYWDKNVPGQYFTFQGAKDLEYVNVILEAGYGQEIHKVFQGHLMWADSAREGTNIITHISANSGLPDVLGTQVNVTLNAPVTAQQILLFLSAQFPSLKLGAIGSFPTVFNRSVSLRGMAWDLIQQYASPGSAFIDNGKIYILNNKEVSGAVFLINDATGILQTPRRENSYLIVTTLMETGVQNIGQMVQIQSSVMPRYNGTYKVYAVQHRGMISDAVCGRMNSIFTLLAPGLYGSANQPGSGFVNVPLAQAVAA